MSSIIPDNPSPQLSAALRWVEGFNNWNLDMVLSVAADDYMHHILPKSLGKPPRNKEQFRAYFTKVLPTFIGFQVKILDIIEGPGKVWFHATSTATSMTGAPYANEYNVVLYFTTQADGVPKISVVKEFVDSKYSVDFFREEDSRQAAREVEQGGPGQ